MQDADRVEQRSHGIADVVLEIARRLDVEHHEDPTGDRISEEEEHEVTLHAERPVVDTETTPVERVRLSKEEVTGTERVSGEVRKERVDTDNDGRGGPKR